MKCSTGRLRANRAFLGRAVRYLAGEAGISQFLDIGTGIPTSPNVHEVAQAVEPAARIVYVDNDPIVLTQARALLTTGPQGEPMGFDDRVSEVFARYGEDSLVSEALRRARPHLAAAVEATEELLRRRGVVDLPSA